MIFDNNNEDDGEERSSRSKKRSSSSTNSSETDGQSSVRNRDSELLTGRAPGGPGKSKTSVEPSVAAPVDGSAREDSTVLPWDGDVSEKAIRQTMILEM